MSVSVRDNMIRSTASAILQQLSPGCFQQINSNRLLHRPLWKPDMVYLIQYPVSPHIRTISPFTLKLETWLRLNQILYDNVHTIHPHPAVRQIPYIEFNGEEIPDSNIIIETLSQKFDQHLSDRHLSDQQMALAHALTIMVEHHTAQIGFYWRYGHHNTEFAAKLTQNFAEKKVSMFFFKHIQPYGLRLKGYLNGFARHSFEQIAQMSYRDLDAISQILGKDNKYILGTKTATTLDCLLFGHLAQFLYIPMDFPQKAYMHSNCKNIVHLVDRIREEAWPDWDQMCVAKSMRGKMGKDFENSKLNK